MVQPLDYKEASGSDMKTKSILENIKKWFPNLIHSEKYEGIYQGILISKKSYDNEVIGTNKMGTKEVIGTIPELRYYLLLALKLYLPVTPL